MTKGIKIVSLDTDIIEWLKEQDNASQIVERLVRKEMETNGLNSLSLEQLKALKEIREEKKAIEAREREIWKK